jgi:hypothetical protein
MARQSQNPSTTGQPTLNELLAHYLADGDIQPAPSAAALVEPYDAVTRQPVDTRLAWRCACAGLSAGNKSQPPLPPPEWAALVQQQESTPAIAFAAGNFPQLLRDLPSLVQADKLSNLLEAQAPALDLPGLSAWAESQAAISFARRLVAAGVLRLARQFDHAAELLAAKAKLTSSEQARLQSEVAAQAWHEGKLQVAIQKWSTLAPENVFVQFNRGMAALFGDEPVAALQFLQTVSLSDDDPWRHLLGLYMALAEMRI